MMKQQSAFLAWILRMPLIKRWALMHSIKSENVAEHSHQVAVIAHLLAVIRNTYFNGNINPDKVATTALYHEVSETKLQDINHVNQEHNPALTAEFKKLEALAEQECLATLPPKLQPLFDSLLIQNNVDPEYKQIVKAADLLSAYLKAKDELRFGNHEFDHVAERLSIMIQNFAKDMPEVDFFLETFAELCAVSVDELSHN